jgi:hypothetical protein
VFIVDIMFHCSHICVMVSSWFPFSDVVLASRFCRLSGAFPELLSSSGSRALMNFRRWKTHPVQRIGADPETADPLQDQVLVSLRTVHLLYTVLASPSTQTDTLASVHPNSDRLRTNLRCSVQTPRGHDVRVQTLVPFCGLALTTLGSRTFVQASKTKIFVQRKGQICNKQNQEARLSSSPSLWHLLVGDCPTWSFTMMMFRSRCVFWCP